MRFSKYTILSFFVILCISGYANAVTFKYTPAQIVTKNNMTIHNKTWKTPSRFTPENPGMGTIGYYDLTRYKKIQMDLKIGSKWNPIYINMHAETTVTDWTMDNAEKMIVNMIGDLENIPDAEKFNGYNVYIVRQQGSSTAVRSTGTDTFTIFTQDYICATQNGRKNTWITPIHEFGHGMDNRLKLNETSRKLCLAINSSDIGQYECFAWASEHWFNVTTADLKSSGSKTMSQYRQNLLDRGDINWQKFYSYYDKYFLAAQTWQPTCEGRPVNGWIEE